MSKILALTVSLQRVQIARMQAMRGPRGDCTRLSALLAPMLATLVAMLIAAGAVAGTPAGSDTFDRKRVDPLALSGEDAEPSGRVTDTNGTVFSEAAASGVTFGASSESSGGTALSASGQAFETEPAGTSPQLGQPGGFQPLQINPFIWTGNGGNTTWSNAANWTPAGPPGATGTAVFDNTGTILTPNITGNTSIGAILFDAGTTQSYNITGTSRFDLGSATNNDGITNLSDVTQTFSVNEVEIQILNCRFTVAGAGDLVFSANTLIDINGNSRSLILDGSSTGVGIINGTMNNGRQNGVTKTGTGTWELNGMSDFRVAVQDGTLISNSPAGVTNRFEQITVTGGSFFMNGVTSELRSAGAQITGGTLFVNGNMIQSGSPTVTVSGTGTLAGTGTVGTTSGEAIPIVANAGGTISPGLGPGTTGILSNFGNSSLNAGSNFVVDINGTTVGTGYDQLNSLGGTVTLGGNLVVNVGASSLTPGDMFTILNKTAAGAIVGTFAGLPEGSEVIATNGWIFSITYVGGNGNDVVLTFLAVPEAGTWFAGLLTFAALGFTQRRRFVRGLSRFRLFVRRIPSAT